MPARSPSLRGRRALQHGPLLGRFKMVYFPLNLRMLSSVYINHFETPTYLSYVSPALPVPRPGRDREARSYWNIIWSLYYFSAEFYLLMPHKPACPGATWLDQPIKPLSQVWARGLGRGPPWRDMHGISRYCCNVLEVPRPELRPCKRGLGQGHNQKKRHPYP